MFKGKWGVVALLGALAAGYIYYKNTEVMSAEYDKYDIEGQNINNYGSLENPQSLDSISQGRAAGQTASQAEEYGVELAMTVPGVGQNYSGRAFGL